MIEKSWLKEISGYKMNDIESVAAAVQDAGAALTSTSSHFDLTILNAYVQKCQQDAEFRSDVDRHC